MIGLDSDNGMHLQRISDYGAQRILNMGGSLRGYIETGNQYDSFYYRGEKRGRNYNNIFKSKEQKSKEFLADLAVGAVSILAIITGIFAVKKGLSGNISKLNFHPIQKLKTIAGNIGSKIKNSNLHPIEKLKSGFSNLATKIKNSNFHPIQKLKSIFSKNKP